MLTEAPAPEQSVQGSMTVNRAHCPLKTGVWGGETARFASEKKKRTCESGGGIRKGREENTSGGVAGRNPIGWFYRVIGDRKSGSGGCDEPRIDLSVVGLAGFSLVIVQSFKLADNFSINFNKT